MEKIALVVGYLAKIVADSASATGDKLKELTEKRTDLAERKAEIYSQTQGKTKEYNECLSKMQTLFAKRT